MTKRVVPILWVIMMGNIARFGVPNVAAQTPPPPPEVQSTFNTVDAPVLKVYSAEEGGHRFVAYLVKWNNSEVVVSDPLARSDFQKGDMISFIVQKVSLPGSPMKVTSLSFLLLDATPFVLDRTGSEGEAISPEDRTRQMKIAQGDLDAAKSEIERFYALNHAAKNALRKGETEKARVLASEPDRLIPNYRNDWNYGNAVQDANQVLGLIALGAGDVVEAQKRLLASADSQGSPQMNSFGPNMQLAQALLKKGERDVVLEYFKRCGAFWEMGEARLAEWTASVNKGEIPEFGANLMY